MNIGIIGCGQMGRAFAEAWSSQQTLCFYDRHPERAEQLAQKGCGSACREIQQLVQHCDIILLAVKPQNLAEIAELVHPHIQQGQTLLSLLAGTPIAALKTYFPSCRIFRLMPNLAILCGEGMVAFSAEESLDAKEKEAFAALLKPLGRVYWLPEAKLDGFTSLAGSGPAFFFALLEAIVEAGVAVGFGPQESQGLAVQMIKGGIVLLEKTGKHPAELKWQITSAGGTTIAGLRKFEEAAVRAGIMQTFIAACERAKELSQKKGS